MTGIWVAAFFALWAVVVALAVVSVGLVRQLGMVHMRLGVDPGALITREGLPRGTEAPDFEAVDLGSLQRIRLSAYRGRRVALIFLSTGCLACRELVPHLNRMARDRAGEVDFLAVCAGTDNACREFTRSLKLETKILLDPTGAIGEKYGVAFNPFTFLIDQNGVILTRGVVNTWSQVEALLNEEGTVRTYEPGTNSSNGIAHADLDAEQGLVSAMKGSNRG